MPLPFIGVAVWLGLMMELPMILQFRPIPPNAQKSAIPVLPALRTVLPITEQSSTSPALLLFESDIPKSVLATFDHSQKFPCTTQPVTVGPNPAPTSMASNVVSVTKLPTI